MPKYIDGSNVMWFRVCKSSWISLFLFFFVRLYCTVHTSKRQSRFLFLLLSEKPVLQSEGQLCNWQKTLIWTMFFQLSVGASSTSWYSCSCWAVQPSTADRQTVTAMLQRVKWPLGWVKFQAAHYTPMEWPAPKPKYRPFLR